MKRNVKFIVVHCTATPQDTSVKSLREAWKEILQCEDAPYHYIIEKDGETVQLLHENCIAGGAFPNNALCMHIAYIGGRDKEGKPKDTRTFKQKDALFGRLAGLSDRYPEAEIMGADEFSGTDVNSPGFDVKKWLGDYMPDLSERPWFEHLESEEEGEIAA